jgi:hypothetical protein
MTPDQVDELADEMFAAMVRQMQTEAAEIARLSAKH